jgi:hypothetical protein
MTNVLMTKVLMTNVLTPAPSSMILLLGKPLNPTTAQSVLHALIILLLAAQSALHALMIDLLDVLRLPGLQA